MAEAAIIFDVDGVLLELTRAEEELFFQPFSGRCDTTKLSRDWNSYAIRNDEDIVAELVQQLALPQSEKLQIKNEYLALLQTQITTGKLLSKAIIGAATLLDEFTGKALLGIATANYRDAARMRLTHANVWNPVSSHAYGADGGGHKREILGRALAALNLPKSRIVYIGDNINDLTAGLTHGVHFIGFSTNQKHLQTLTEAGAKHLSSDHSQTAAMIKTLLNL